MFDYPQMILDGMILVSAFAPVAIVLAQCAVTPLRDKPGEIYDTGPTNYELDAMKREQFRKMLRGAQHDDEASDAIDWAFYVLRIGKAEIEEILDEVQPLGSPDQKAALAVRREYQLRVVG